MAYSKKKKQLITLAILFVAFLVVKNKNFSPMSYLESKVEESVLTPIKEKTPGFNYSDFELKFPLRLSLKDIQALIPAKPIPIPLKVDELKARIELPQLFLLRLESRINAMLYQGYLKFKTSSSYFSKKSTANLNIEKLELSSHPGLYLFNVGGQISVDAQSSFKNESKQLKDIDSLSIALNLENGSYSGGHMIHGIFKTPEIRDANAQINLVKYDDEIVVENSKFKSSLANGKISGKFTVNEDTQLLNGDFKLNIKFSENGHESLGQFAALAANMDIETVNRSWEIDYKLVNSKILNPKVKPSASF